MSAANHVPDPVLSVMYQTRENDVMDEPNSEIPSHVRKAAALFFHAGFKLIAPVLTAGHTCPNEGNQYTSSGNPCKDEKIKPADKSSVSVVLCSSNNQLTFRYIYDILQHTR